MKMNNNRWGKKMCFGIFGVLLLFLLPLAIMGLWNNILPEIINVSTISYWQALGLFVLSRILFGGFGHGRRCGGKPSFGGRGIKERFMNMTDDEKVAFKQRWKERCNR